MIKKLKHYLEVYENKLQEEYENKQMIIKNISMLGDNKRYRVVKDLYFELELAEKTIMVLRGKIALITDLLIEEGEY